MSVEFEMLVKQLVPLSQSVEAVIGFHNCRMPAVTLFSVSVSIERKSELTFDDYESEAKRIAADMINIVAKSVVKAA